MIIIGPDSRQERLEVMLWTAGTGLQTSAVCRFIVRYRLTFAAAIITREYVWLDDVVRRN
jgi:hypothetical protein